MTLTLIDPTAAAKIEANRARLRANNWGGTETVCMMSALVAGAKSTDACVTAGWPRWLVNLNVYLFDANVGVPDENAARYDFALAIARAVQTPRDYDRARDLFLIARLDTGAHSALKFLAKALGDWPEQRAAIEAVVALLYARLAGEDVTEQMKDARAAAANARDVANAYAYAAANAAADARDAANAYADAAAAYAAADAAAAYAAAAYAAADADAYAAAAYAAAYADAYTAARAAARADLIAAIEAS